MRRFLLGALLTACGADGGSETNANRPPVWVDAPASIVVHQGVSLELPFTLEDPEGEAVTANIVAPPELEVTIVDGVLRLRPDYSASGPTDIVVELTDTAGNLAALRLPLEAKPLAWTGRNAWPSGGPEAREHGSVIVDGDRVLLFGGSGYSPYLEGFADLWEYDLSTEIWTSLRPVGDVPSPGGSRRVAQLPGERAAYLFGGYGDGGAPDDGLYRVDFADEVRFTAVPQQNTPSSPTLHAFFYDGETDAFYAFGGLDNSTHRMNLIDGEAVWTRLTTATAPSPRFGFFWGFDSVLGRLILFSGDQGNTNPAQDTWVLNVRRDPVEWEMLVAGGGPSDPPGRRNGAFIWDPDAERLVVFGGTADGERTEPGLWVLDARQGREAWLELELEGGPPPRSSGFGFYDAPRSRVLLGFGNSATSVFADWNTLGY